MIMGFGRGHKSNFRQSHKIWLFPLKNHTEPTTSVGFPGIPTLPLVCPKYKHLSFTNHCKGILAFCIGFSDAEPFQLFHSSYTLMLLVWNLKIGDTLTYTGTKKNWMKYF